MTLAEVVAVLRERYAQVELFDGAQGGTALIVNGLVFGCSAWYPEDSVPDRFLWYLCNVLDELDPRDLGLDQLED